MATFTIGKVTYTVDRAFVYGPDAIELYAVVDNRGAGHNAAPIKIAKMVGDPAYYFMPARKPARKIGAAHTAKLDAAARLYVAEVEAETAHAEALIDGAITARLATFAAPASHAEAVARMRAILFDTATLKAGIALDPGVCEQHYSLVVLRWLTLMVAAAYASPYALHVGQRVRITDADRIVAWNVAAGTEATITRIAAPHATHVLVKLDDGREIPAHYAELDTI